MSPEQIEELRIDLAGGTPRPWRYSPQKMVVETDAEFICDMGLYPPSQGKETEQADRNGELVVNAVNSVERLLNEREALIEALREAEEHLRGRALCDGRCKTLKTVRAALAYAEKELGPNCKKGRAAR